MTEDPFKESDEQFKMKKNYLLLSLMLGNSETMKLEYQQALSYALDILEGKAREIGIKFNKHGRMET